MDAETPVFAIAVAAELAGMHPQTLRQYDRLGLVSPTRTPGQSRRYSMRDVVQLREIAALSAQGLNLEGIRRILELENQVAALQDRVAELSAELETRRRGIPDAHTRVFSVSPSGDVYAARPGERPRHLNSQALVLWSGRLGSSRP